uniref:Cyclin-A2-1 n=1 Tax=Anthurium amnicola TaxID=1678845 RepID=A0A1D1YVE0_9ARAE
MKENTVVTGYAEVPARLTRARAAACRATGSVLSLKPSLTKPESNRASRGNSIGIVQDENNPRVSLPAAVQHKKRAVLKDVTNVCCESTYKKACHQTGSALLARPPLTRPENKQLLRGNSKRAALDVSNQSASVTVAVQQKKRAVLKDATNIYCDSSFQNCLNAAKVQRLNSQKLKLGASKARNCIVKKNFKFGFALPSGSASACENEKINVVRNIEGIRVPEPQVVTISQLEGAHPGEGDMKNVQDRVNECGAVLIDQQDAQVASELSCPLQNVKNKPSEDRDSFTKGGFIDIDSDHKNPQLCSLYAPVIYMNLRAAELVRRPHSNFIETLQQDITQSMRGILIDWLVEVSEEYKLVPDTLYLTVYLIDRFLSENYIERQRLQLLGITCMLIASKYEEILAPRVEEFCFITDNTYSKGDVIKMEGQILKYLGFQMSVPTIKTFLRRFLRAAQASYKVPSLELEFLANYLAELTLVEYSFLKFLPSTIAASAVFLARWMLDQSGHPWNSTLEHYTCYRASDLRATVLALHDLQMTNATNYPLRAVRQKYSRVEFKSVATLPPEMPLPTLFPTSHETRAS